jgi:small subunit ribosomal protein S5
MAEKETRNEPKNVVEPTPEEITKIKNGVETIEEGDKALARELGKKAERLKIQKEALAVWSPKTKIGKLVKAGKEKDIDKILSEGKKILEPEIVDSLLKIESDLLLIGQAKGKFGGGKRRAWKQTQKKTQEGNVVSFSAMAVVGDKSNHIGVGYGKASETLPAREKALRNAKLNIIKIKLGFESPELEEEGSKPHTIPFKIEGKSGSVRIVFWPAPRGTGLVVGDELKKILKLAGIKDIYSKTIGQTRTTTNFAKACIDALQKTTKIEK